MTFLNTEVEGQVTPPWSSRWTLEKDTLTQGLASTGMGFVTVMLPTLLLYPLWSLMYVQESQLLMNRNISQVIQMMMDYYSEDDPNVYQKDAVLRHLRDWQSITDDNEPLIRAAWWECFGMGRTQMKRHVLHAMDQASTRVYYLAFNAWAVSDAEGAKGTKGAKGNLNAEDAEGQATDSAAVANHGAFGDCCCTWRMAENVAAEALGDQISDLVE